MRQRQLPRETFLFFFPLFTPILFLLFAACALPASATPPSVSITEPGDGATWDTLRRCVSRPTRSTSMGR